LLILFLHFSFCVFCFRSLSPFFISSELFQGRSEFVDFQVLSLSTLCFKAFFSFCAMVVIRECDERGRELRPVDPLERAKLQWDCLRHATRQNDIIDWEAYNLSYFSHMSMSDLSSESDSDDYDDSDCVFLYSTSGKEVVVYVTPQRMQGKGVSSLGSNVDTEIFGDDVQSYNSMYCDQTKVELFRSKNSVSSTGREEDVDLLPFPLGEIVCVLRPKGVKEIFFICMSFWRSSG